MTKPEPLLEYVIAVSRQMAEIRDPDTLYSYVIDEVLSLVGAERGFLVLVDEEGALDFKATRTQNGEHIETDAGDQISRSILNYVLQHKESLVLGDALLDPRFAKAHSVTRHRLRSVMCVPLITQEKIIGTLYVENRSIKSRFRQSDIDPLTLFANQAAVSLENARLYSTLEDQVEKRTADLAGMTLQLATIMQELRKSKKEADVANRAKSSFLANMSHELRTPLNGVLGYAQILQRDENLTPNGREGLRTIYENGKYLLMLIEDVLDLAKAEANQLALYPQELNLPAFLNSIVTLMRLSAQQKDLFFDYQAESRLPQFILADETRLRQVLLNLIGNAVKFTNTGKVCLRVQTGQPATLKAHPAEASDVFCRLRFEISDTGPGLAKQYIEEIFLPFVQVESAAQPAVGTGLGLTISQQIVNLMGGRIEIESELGQGSTFSFEIDIPVLTGAKTGPAVFQIVRGYRGRRRRILVVDDQPENQAVMLNFLEPLGFEIDLAGSGRAAIELAAQNAPDLIFMDIVLPDITGLEAVTTLRQDDNFSQTPMIAVSASVGEAKRAQSLTAGCDGFLAKPVEMDTLLDLIAQQLDLEWIYEEGEPTLPDQNKVGEATVEIIVPSKAVLSALYQLARAGNLNRLQAQTEQLAQEDPKYLAFGQQLQHYLDQLDMRQARRFIEHFLVD